MGKISLFDGSISAILLNLFILASLQQIYKGNLFYTDLHFTRNAMELLYQKHNNLMEFTNEQQGLNLKECLQNDLEKFYHPDVINQDSYILRSINDGALWSIMEYDFDNCAMKGAIEYAAEVVKGNTTQGFPPQSRCLQRFSKYNTIEYYIRPEEYSTPRQNEQSWCLLKQFIRLNHQKTSLNKFTVADRQLNRYYSAIENNKSQQCINDLQYQSLSYDLKNKTQCQSVMKVLSGQQDGEQADFILKIDTHKAAGVNLLTPQFKQDLLKQFENGEKCGDIEYDGMLQTYIGNPLLYNGYKLEFRFYVLIFQMEPFIAYLNINPLATMCIQKYEGSQARESHICNPYVSRAYWEDKNNNFTERIHPEYVFIYKTLLQWGEYFQGQGKLTDPQSWVDNIVLPMLNKKIAYMMHDTYHPLKKDPRVSTFLGLDIIIDDNFDARIVDINFTPNSIARYPDFKIFINDISRNFMKVIKILLQKKFVKLRAFLESAHQRKLQIPSDINDQEYKSIFYLDAKQDAIPYHIHDNRYLDLQGAIDSCN